MHSWEAIQTTLTYIEEHYDEKMEIETLAKIAHLSKYYYQRLFYRLTHKSVQEYVRLRRLAHAAKRLKETDEKISDVAIACGFSSHSNFTSSFKETYGIPPEEYRTSKLHLDHMIKPDLSLSYTMIDCGVPLMTEDMVLEIQIMQIEEDMSYIGTSTIASRSSLTEPKINTLVELWKKMEGTEQIGVDIMTPCEDPEQFRYFVGIEGDLPNDDQEVQWMPKGDYVVCTYEAENFEQLVNEALYKASKYVFETWIPKHQLCIEPLMMQKYVHPFAKDCYVELWIKLVSKTKS